MKYTPIDNDILFQFTDHVTSLGFFREKTAGGIILAQSQLTAAQNSSHHKTAIVKSVGPKCVDIKEGMLVIIEALKWTPQFEVEGNTLWKTTEEYVMAVIED